MSQQNADSDADEEFNFPDEREDETPASGVAVPADTEEYDGDGRPPEDAIASPEDFKVQRDGDSERTTVWQKVPGDGKWIEVIPLSQGDANEYLPASGNPGDISDEQFCRLVNDRVVTPEFALDEARAEQEVADFKAFGVDPLVMAIFDASGFTMSRGMVVENADMLQAVEGNSRTGN